jgi:DNA-binding GntR family transcriptional regulator
MIFLQGPARYETDLYREYRRTMNIALSLEIPQSLTDVAVARIRAAIVDGTLGLGQQISESALASSFGISKTPVREALMRLQQEGLVTIQPRRGTFVFTLGEQELAAICDCRTILETAALRMGMERQRPALAKSLSAVTGQMEKVWDSDAATYRRLDTAFHQCFLDHCNNQYLAEAYQLISGKMAALRTRLSLSPDHVRKSYDEHLHMTKLVQDGDVDSAIPVLEGHIGRRQGSYWITKEALSS